VCKVLTAIPTTIMAARRPLLLPALAAGVTCAVLMHVTHLVSVCTFTAGSTIPQRNMYIARKGLMDGFDLKEMEKMMKDPEKMKQLQSQVDSIMNDPAKKKAFEEYQTQMQTAVAGLKDDPEMKPFFEEVEKNGPEAAIKMFETNENILRKFSLATGGPLGMPGMPGAGGMPAPPPAVAPTFKPGDQVIISGLAKAPELNGKKAMVVPPTSEEKKSLEGTNRLIVRLIDSGDQFAVKASNLRTTEQAASDLMEKGLEDVSLYNPALQTEAAKLRESGKLDDLKNDPELAPVFADIKENGMGALEKYWNDEKLMAKISKAMAS